MSGDASTLQPGTLQRIPVVFIANPLAVNQAALLQLLGLDDGRSVQAQKKAAWLFCRRNNIRKLPGKVWPLRAIERAVNQDEQEARVNRMRKDCHEKAQGAQRV